MLSLGVMASRKKIKRYTWTWSGRKASKRFYKDQKEFKKQKYLILRSGVGGEVITVGS
jgi:hypothetical protein